MKKHRFIVTVEADSAYKAAVVMTERMDHDEDYGFTYVIEWETDRGRSEDHEKKESEHE